MADLADERKLIQIEETRFRFAVSESWAQKIGKAINFILNREHKSRRWDINGIYSGITLPYNGIDGYEDVHKDIEILDVFMFIQTAGSGGTTEIDIQKASAPGGAWTSIFSTTPKITSAAGSGTWVRIGGSGVGLTAPILSSANLSAGDVLRCNLVQAQSGSPNGTGIVLHYRPR